MKKFFTTLLLALIPFFVVAQTISLPFSYDGGKNNLPEGVEGENLGKDYKNSPHIKLDNNTAKLTFNLPEHNGLTFSFDWSKSGTAKEYFLKVQISTNGKDFKDVTRTNVSSKTTKSILITRCFVSIPRNYQFIKISYHRSNKKAVMRVGNFHIKAGVSFKVTEAGYATFYSDKHVYLPQEVKASIVEENGSGIKVKELNNQVIKSQTPILLQAKAGDYVAEPLETAKGAANTTGNILKGSLTDEEVTATAGQKLYVLTTGSKGVGFYWQKDTQGNSAKVGVGHAYLSRPFTSGGVQGFSLVDPIVTGVETVETQNTKEDAPIYDLSGRRVTHPTHGIYIISGKKVMR